MLEELLPLEEVCRGLLRFGADPAEDGLPRPLRPTRSLRVSPGGGGALRDGAGGGWAAAVVGHRGRGALPARERPQLTVRVGRPPAAAGRGLRVWFRMYTLNCAAGWQCCTRVTVLVILRGRGASDGNLNFEVVRVRR